MSQLEPPPIPCKTKNTILISKHHCSTKEASFLNTNENTPMCLESNLHFAKFAPYNSRNSIAGIVSSLSHLNCECSKLKNKDRELMKTFMCIRGAFKYIRKIFSDTTLDPVKTLPYSFQNKHLCNKSGGDVIHRFCDSPISFNLGNKACSFFESNISFETHFDIPHIAKIATEFLETSICNQILSTIECCGVKYLNKVEDKEISIKSAAPPIPSKKKQHLNNSLSKNNGKLDLIADLTSECSVLSDPVGVNTTSVLLCTDPIDSHSRQSSITLSDFYDHLQPNFPKKYHEIDTFTKSLNLPKLPKSKSEIDCKFISLSSNDRQIDLTIIPNSNDSCRLDIQDSPKIISPNFNAIETNLKRADSTPLLLNTLVSETNKKYMNNSSHIGKASTLSKYSNDLYSQSTSVSSKTISKSKESRARIPKKNMSFFSRKISHTNQKSLGPDCKKNIDEFNSKDYLSDCTSDSKSLLTKENVSKNHFETPPPIPPKLYKMEKSLDMHQTWC